MTTISVAADTHDVCGESPIWNPAEGALLWVDNSKPRLHKLAADGTLQSITSPVPVGGITLTDSADLVIAGGDGVFIYGSDGSTREVAREHEGERLAINDCIADPQGRLLIGSAFFDDGKPECPKGSLYVIERDSSVRLLDTGFGLSNGLGFSVDNRRLYFTDSVARRIYAYDYDALAGKVANRRVLVQVPSHEGLPDGLTVDAEGFIWSAQWFGACICRYDPDGTLERRVTIPAKQTSSLAFGGRELTDIYVTSAALSDALPLAPPQYQATGSIGGPLFHLNLGIAGKPEHHCLLHSNRSPKDS